MRIPHLDERLSAAADLFPACAYGADIGADHGRLSCYLLTKGRCQRMCVADISADSLEKAKALLALHQLSDRADLCVGDGLDVLPQPAQAIAILGMGGRTLAGILTRGKDRLNGACLILSAHTEVFLVREALAGIGYRIGDERIVRAANRYYVILRAESGRESYTEKQIYLGPRLLESREKIFLAYLSWQKQVIGRGETSQKRKAWIEEELNRDGNCEGHL